MLLEYIDYYMDDKRPLAEKVQSALALAQKRTTRPFAEVLVPAGSEAPTAVGGLPVRVGDVKANHIYIVLGGKHDDSQR
jgi:hypothetical protein